MAIYLVQHRRGTAEQWAEQNTLIPREGEIVIEIDEVNSLHKLKIGDGIHAYAELAYLMAGDEIVTQVLSQALPRIVTITLDVDKWVESTDVVGCYYQPVALEGVTQYSRLDLQPDATMIADLKSLGVSFVTENIGGEIIVNSVGNKPTATYTMQATVVEADVVEELDKVVGIPVGASNPDLAPVAISGSYNDLSDTPEIPSLDGYATEEYVTDAINNAQLSGGGSDIDLSVYALKSEVPDELADLKDDMTHRTVTDAEKEAWNAKSTFSGSYNDLSDKPSFATEAFVAEKIAEAQLNSDDVDLSEYAKKEDIPSTTDDIEAGTRDIWIFDCGTSTEVI